MNEILDCGMLDYRFRIKHTIRNVFSFSWMPIISGDGCLGEFVPGLGPGQVVGRQVLASPCLGEIQLQIVDKGGNLDIRIIRARHLVKKPGAKYNPGIYCMTVNFTDD